MAWADITPTTFISFNAAATSPFTTKVSLPSSDQFMSKVEIIEHLYVQESYLSGLTDSQWVYKSLLVNTTTTTTTTSTTSTSTTTTTTTVIGGIDSYTKLMLHLNGNDSSTTFVDSEITPKTVTPYGDVKIKTDQSKFGGSSAYFDGTGDYLNIPDNADWDTGSGDWTVDFWMKTSGTPTNRHMIGRLNSSGSGVGIFYFMLAGAKITFYNNDGSGKPVTSTTSVNNNTWHHIAGVVSGHVIKLYIDGVSEGTPVSGFGGNADSTLSLSIGRIGDYDNGTNGSFVGWIDEFRFSKGIARWTSNFTPPTSEYTL